MRTIIGNIKSVRLLFMVYLSHLSTKCKIRKIFTKNVQCLVNFKINWKGIFWKDVLFIFIKKIINCCDHVLCKKWKKVENKNG